MGVTVEDIDRAPTNLPAPANYDWHARYIEINERFTKVAEEKFLLLEENSRLKGNNSTRSILDELIKPYAMNSFRFMCFYCGFVGIILIAAGYKLYNFSLSDDVLQIMVGSTAVTVIGLVGMVLTGVFIGARGK